MVVILICSFVSGISVAGLIACHIYGRLLDEWMETIDAWGKSLEREGHLYRMLADCQKATRA